METENIPQNDNGLVEQTRWIWQNEQMIKKPITFVPGLYKIFDEVLVNAADNKQRDSVKVIKVHIDVANNLISVWNNGITISNYDDWYGANNIFLTELTIETADGERNEQYKQVL